MPRRDSTYTRLPGLPAACEERFWTIRDGANYTGLRWATFRDAYEGKPVDRETARKIAAALDAHPVTPSMRELLEAAT